MSGRAKVFYDRFLRVQDCQADKKTACASNELLAISLSNFKMKMSRGGSIRFESLESSQNLSKTVHKSGSFDAFCVSVISIDLCFRMLKAFLTRFHTLAKDYICIKNTTA